MVLDTLVFPAPSEPAIVMMNVQCIQFTESRMISHNHTTFCFSTPACFLPSSLVQLALLVFSFWFEYFQLVHDRPYHSILVPCL